MKTYRVYRTRVKLPEIEVEADLWNLAHGGLAYVFWRKYKDKGQRTHEAAVDAFSFETVDRIELIEEDEDDGAE